VKVKLTPKRVCGIYLHIAFKFAKRGDARGGGEGELKIIRDIIYDCVSSNDAQTFKILGEEEAVESDEEDEDVYDNLELIKFEAKG